MTIRNFPVEKITLDCDNFQFRSVTLNEDRVQQLVNNWNGEILDPLDIWHDKENQKYYVLAGHHRLAAAIALKVEKLPCRVHQTSLDEAKIIALASNANRLEYTAAEKSRCIDYLVSIGKSYGEIASVMSMHEAMARKYHCLKLFLNSPWEGKLDNVIGRAFEIGGFCTRNNLDRDRAIKLLGVAVEQNLHDIKLREFLRVYALNKSTATPSETVQSALFDHKEDEIPASMVESVEKRSQQIKVGVKIWGLYSALEKQDLSLPEDLQQDVMQQLRRLYAHIVGSDNAEETPQRTPSKALSQNDVNPVERSENINSSNFAVMCVLPSFARPSLQKAFLSILPPAV